MSVWYWTGFVAGIVGDVLLIVSLIYRKRAWSELLWIVSLPLIVIGVILTLTLH